jgi:hypothetical protein
VDPAPLADVHGLYSGSGTPDVFISIFPPYWQLADFHLPPITFGNPFPASWPLFAQVSENLRYPVLIPGARNVPTQVLSFVQRDSFANITAQMTPSGMVPTLGPVQSLTINGIPARYGIGSVGLTPTIAWSPPVLGVPSYYRVALSRAHRNLMADGTYFIDTNQRISSTFTTGQTVTLAPGLIEAGKDYYYYVVVYAILEPGTDATFAHPFRGVLGTNLAPAISGVFSP